MKLNRCHGGSGVDIFLQDLSAASISSPFVIVFDHRLNVKYAHRTSVDLTHSSVLNSATQQHRESEASASSFHPDGSRKYVNWFINLTVL